MRTSRKKKKEILTINKLLELIKNNPSTTTTLTNKKGTHINYNSVYGIRETVGYRTTTFSKKINIDETKNTNKTTPLPSDEEIINTITSYKNIGPVEVILKETKTTNGKIETISTTFASLIKGRL